MTNTTRQIVQRLLAEAGIASYSTMDSLDTLDLCLAIEKEFGIIIPDSRLGVTESEDALVELIDGLRSPVRG
jgi:acyl carrier protein